MSIDLTKLTIYVPNNSVIDSPDGTGEDTTQPFSYTSWLEQVGMGLSSDRDYTTEYNKYIKSWNQFKELSRKQSDISGRYKQLLKNIALNYTTPEEKRFLSNIDYDKPWHVSAATSFFSKKIKEIALYYSDARQQIRQSSIRNMSSGSVKSIEQYTYNEISNAISERELLGGVLMSDESKYNRKNVVNIVEKFEIEDDVKYSTQINFDKDLFIDIQQSIKNLLQECLPVLQIADGLSFSVSEEVSVTDENISLLGFENFIDYEKDADKLSILTLKEYVPKLVGTDMSILSGGTLETLFEGEMKHRNILDRKLPGITTTTNSPKRTKNQLGDLYVPQNMGVLSYYSHAPIIDQPKTTSEPVVTFDLNRYGQGDLVTYFEDVSWVKADASNDGVAGDIIDAVGMPRFYSYRSAEDTQNQPTAGMSRHDDPVGFFEGDGNEDWANPDVFPPEAVNIYQINERQTTLLVGDEEMTEWGTDIFGNEYGLYKRTPAIPARVTQSGGVDDEYFTNSTCRIIDGGDSLRPRSRLWNIGVDYKIFEGGRRWDVDPKVEQRREMTPFEDLRQIEKFRRDDGTTFEAQEQHNAWDYQPNSTRTRMTIQQLTYHGFKKKGIEPVYDEQAYCGLFTDVACGAIDPSQIDCVTRDNYAFGTFSDIISTVGDQTFYVSTIQPVTATRDAFEAYINSDYDDMLTFKDDTYDNSVEILMNQDIDGNFFTDEGCFDEPAEYEYETDTQSEYFDVPTNISQTKYASIDQLEVNDATSYEQQSDTGRILFRSYNNTKILELSEVLLELTTSTGDAVGSDRVRFRDQIKGNQVLGFNVYYDVLVIQTLEFLYIERMNFDAENCLLLRSDFPGMLLRTSSDDVLVKSFKPYYNKNKHELICGFTSVHDVHDMKYVYPKIFHVDMNTIYTNQIFPNKDYTEGVQDYVLTDELSAFQYEQVDTPIISYNETIDSYSVSYTCKLSGGDQVTHGVCINDFEPDSLNFRMTDIMMNHSTPVTRYTTNLSKWEQKLLDKTILFRTNEIPIPYTTDTEYYYNLNSIIDNSSFKGYQIRLTFDTRTLPTQPESPKINKIVFDPGDGTEKVFNIRQIYTGFEPIDFDIGQIPDQSDFADPRRYQLTHDYYFNETGTYTPSITAVYANYKKLVVNMSFQVDPYTIESGFDSVKLIDTKTFSDPLGLNKQLLVLETQNPRYITHNILTKERYTNSNIVGYLNGVQYAGPYHVMSDGTRMTGDRHTPASQYLTINP